MIEQMEFEVWRAKVTVDYITLEHLTGEAVLRHDEFLVGPCLTAKGATRSAKTVLKWYSNIQKYWIEPQRSFLEWENVAIATTEGDSNG